MDKSSILSVAMHIKHSPNWPMAFVAAEKVKGGCGQLPAQVKSPGTHQSVIAVREEWM